MAFEDVAQRMKDRRGSTQSERLHELWHGEPAPVEPVIPGLEPVPPAKRRSTMVIGYLLTLVGALVIAGAGIAALIFFDTLSRWEFRGVLAIGAVGIALLIQGSTMLEAADRTAPLPNARLRS